MNLFPFSENLFWDADTSSINMQQHKRYVIERVITRGSLEDFKKLLELYPEQEIVNSLKKSKELDPKTRHFCSWYFKIPIHELHASSFYH
ncbi:MAG: hypothetical protein SFU87_16595 [Chitinophagaceae bacterium]|nr:hypothetical protein [Chitinophagaceae bacterium]